MAKRNRLSVGRLVASTNPLRNIIGKRLDVEIKYTTHGLYNRIVNESVIGIRPSF